MKHVLPILSWFACVHAVSAQELKAVLPSGRSSAAALVDQLGHPDFRTREAASKQLLELGERAVSALEAGLSSPVSEVARRCDDLLPAVLQKIDNDALLTPTLVDVLDGEPTLQMVFDSLLKQTGYQLHINGDQSVLSDSVKLPSGKMPFWEVVQAVCVATKLEVTGVDATPAASIRDRAARVGNVWLVAGSGVKRVCVHKAVLIQVTPPTKDELAAYPTTQCPLMVRVFPEPRMRWHRLVELDLAKASDSKGFPIGPALPEPPRLERYQEEMWFLDSKSPVRTGGAETITGGVLKLSVPLDGLTDAATLSGVIRFTAWKPSGEIAAVRLKEGESEGTADGPHGSRLSVKVVGPVSNEPRSTLLKVVHRWNPERVRVEQGGATGDAVWFENVNGRVVPVKPSPPADGAVRPNASGTVVVNAAGEQVSLTAGNTRFDTVTEKGRIYSSMTVEYVARPGKLTDGKPAAVSFHGAQAVELVLPFRVTDVPLAAGAGTGVERRRYKR